MPRQARSRGADGSAFEDVGEDAGGIWPGLLCPADQSLGCSLGMFAVGQARARFGWCGGRCAASAEDWPRIGWRGNTRWSSQSGAL